MISSYFFLSQQPKPYPRYVSESPSPTGVKAIYTYLQKDHKVKRWSHSPDLLAKTNQHEVLIMVEPYFMPGKEKMNAYQKFMEAGNTIILFQGNPNGMFDVKTDFVEGNGDPTKIWSRQGKKFRAEVGSQVRLQMNKKEEVLLRDQAGVIALKRSYGKGRLIVSVTSEWLVNGNLMKDDHIPLVLTVLKEGMDGSVLFDESIHQQQESPSYLTVYPQWFLLIMLQASIIVLLWLWYKGKRFGPIFVLREETVRFSDEGLRALAAWHIRGRRYHDSLLIQEDYVKQLIQERWGIPYKNDWQDLSGHLERKLTRTSAAEIQGFIQGLNNVLEKDKMSKQEYLLWSRKLDQLRKEVEAG